MNSEGNSTLPGPGWELHSFTDSNQKRTIWKSPERKIPFLLKRDAIYFNKLTIDYNGDEHDAWKEYSRQKKKNKAPRHVIKSHLYDEISFPHSSQAEFMISSGNSTKTSRWRNQEKHLTALGWMRKKGGQVPSGNRSIWGSPVLGIFFLWAASALEFEECRQQFDGDEKKALEFFFESKQKQTQNKSKIFRISDFILGGEVTLKQHGVKFSKVSGSVGGGKRNLRISRKQNGLKEHVGSKDTGCRMLLRSSVKRDSFNHGNSTVETLHHNNHESWDLWAARLVEAVGLCNNQTLSTKAGS